MEPLPALVLVVTRFTGLLVFVPMLSSALIPVRLKVLLSLALAVAVFPLVERGAGVPTHLDLFEMAPAMLSELAIGVTIGMVAAVPLMTAQIAGTIMGQQMGLGLAAVFNPAIQIEGDNIGQALFFAAMASFLASGGFDIVYSVLVDTFASVPLGGYDLGRTPLDLIVGVIGAGFEVSIRVAMPVVVILIIESMIVGFIMRTIPSLNIMSFGFPIKILGGLLVTIAAFVIMLEAIMGELDQALVQITDWAGSL